MGNSGVGLRGLNAPHTEQMGWLLAGKSITAKTSGTYTLGGLLQAEPGCTQIRVLKIAKPDTKEVYYFSYRIPVGHDARVPAQYLNRVSVHRYGGGAAKTFLVKTLGDGERFIDTMNGLTVTQLRHDASTATVQVGLACTRTAPTLTALPVGASSQAGAKIRYVVTVKNRDAGTCPATTFAVSLALAPQLQGLLAPSTLTLAPAGSGAVTLDLSTAPTTPVGSYAATVRAQDVALPGHAWALTLISRILVDSVPPSTPIGLTATLVTYTASPQVLLAWKPAKDNIAVADYMVYRNGVHIGASVGVSYVDGGTVPGARYTYQVSARDAAGNRSVGSLGALVQR